MTLKIVTAPTTEPVTLSEAKEHLQIEGTTSNDSYVTRLIPVARGWCEWYTRRWFEPQTWDLWLDGFYTKRLSTRDVIGLAGASLYGGDYAGFIAGSNYPYGPADPYRRITLPFANVSAVSFVKYKDTAGDWQTLTDDTDYQYDLHSEPGRILPAYGKAWPTPRVDINVVQIRLVGGYAQIGSPAESDTPEGIKQAILLIVGDLFERRVDTHIGAGTPAPMPRGVEALLGPYRMFGVV